MVGKLRNKKGKFTQTTECVEVEQNKSLDNTILKVRPGCDLLKTISNLRLNFFNKQMYCNDHLHYSRLRKEFYIHEIVLTKEV